MPTTTRRKTPGGATAGANLQSTVEMIADIPLRIKALETTYNLRGQLSWSMTSTHQLSGNAMVWNVGMTHTDGREIVPIKSGPNPLSLTNQVFREANRILKTEYGLGAGQANSAASPSQRRTA